MPAIEIELARHRVGVAAVGLLDQQQVAEFVGIAMVGQPVFVAASAFELAGVGQPEARLADQVERDIGQRHVFFQRGTLAAQFGEALAQHEGGIGKAQQILDLCIHVRRCGDR